MSPASARRARALLTACLLSAGSGARAEDVALSLPVSYSLVRAALVEQIFIGPGETARVLEGKNGCNVLTLSAPRVEGVGGRLRLTARVTSRGGTPLTRGRCLPLFEWNGLLEATEAPQVLAGQRAIGFRIVDSRILSAEGDRSAVPGALWRWVKENVYPRLETLRVDLEPPLAVAAGFVRESGVREAGALEEALSSLRLTDAVAGVEALDVGVALTAPRPPAGWSEAAPEPALTVEELARWREAWQAWDVFATWLVKQLALAASPTLRDALAGILLDARHDLVAALASDDGGDPVRDLFRKSWARLRPVMRELGATLPAGESLRLLGFVSATDALATLDRAAPHLGFRLDRDALRRLARLLLPSLGDDALVYSTAVDPALRELLGFDALPTTGAATESLPGPALGLLAWLLPSAHAMVSVDPTLASKLQGWVPRGDDLDAYLGQVGLLLEAIAQAERARGRVTAEFVEVYAALLPATAWQETCWRHYEIRNGKVDTLQSPVGSIGIMQINKHVWRGVYDLDALAGDVGYNARAGNEILVHYLVDYAIRRGEHRKRGNPDDLARAAYAIYNGGPGHIGRYRKAETSPALRAIDEAFWRKYRQVRDQGPRAVKTCFGG